MGNVDLSLDNIWERQPDEEQEAYRVFLAFREMGESASVSAALERALKRQPTLEEVQQAEQWARDWEWEERARRWRESVASASAAARDLTERWRKAKDFYDREVPEPRGLARFLRRQRHAGPRRDGFLKRWMREKERRRAIAAEEAAARRAARTKKRRTLAEQWTLFVRNLRSKSEEQKDKGWRGQVRRLKRRIRVVASRHTGRFLLIYGAGVFLVGAFAGMLFLRWRRIVFQNAVVFTVNQASIRRNEFTARLEKAAAKTVMQEMIEQNLRRQFAQAKKAYPSDKEVEARLAEDRKQPNFQKSLAAAGMTLDQYRDAIRDELAQANLVAEGVRVTDEEVRRYYERNIDKRNPQARFYIPETIQVAVIGTRTRHAAEVALNELKEGVPWEDVARAHSQDVSAFSGGVLPPFARGRTMAAMIPGMEATVFALDPGERIGPVKFGEGWWIIQCRDKAPEKTLPFDQVKERAKLWARMEKGAPINGRRIASEYAAFQKKARVQVFDPFFRGLMAR